MPPGLPEVCHITQRPTDKALGLIRCILACHKIIQARNSIYPLIHRYNGYLPGWGAYPPYSPNPWGLQGSLPGHPTGHFAQIYPPPPYPPPHMLPAPPVANIQPVNYGYAPPPPPAASQSVQDAVQDAPSYQWPDGNVKLECTTGQEPDAWDDQGWMWRSSGARKTGVPEGAYKVDKRFCLGVFHCRCESGSGDPTRFFRPRKEKGARVKQSSETCHICSSTLIHVPCEASLTYYRYEDDDGVEHSVRHHRGRHDHARPPIKVLSAADRAALDKQVRENPTLTAQQLRAGAGPTQVALGDINPILLGARKAHSLDTPWIVKSELVGGRFIVMQTPFMRDVLLQDQVRSWHQENLEAEAGRHGVVTDGCHDFFKQGVLLISLVFSQILMRWAPVLFTWIGTLDEHHHKSHFAQLIYAIAESCTRGLGYAFDERLYSAILDFSTAQRNGFISAFVEFMCNRIPGWSTLSDESRKSEASALRLRAEALIKGCIVHWKRSLHKIKQVVGVKHIFRFETLIAVLESERSTAVEFLNAVELLRAEFPEVRPWLSWWILPGNGSMIFPAMQTMPAELRARLPNSTNAGESGHYKSL
ncbi:hypothetical protein C8R46DRAFT_1305420 [Mycena filopes]|nr:hypothetical protein C8R46DRAFT_1305420 [Mycena filopes]